MRSGQTNKTITKILALDQNENDEDHDDAGGRKWRYQRRYQRPKAFEGSWIRLKHFDRHGSNRPGSKRTNEGWTDRSIRRSRFGLVEFLSQILQHSGRALQ